MNAQKLYRITLVLSVAMLCLVTSLSARTAERAITMSSYLDKVRAAWIGKMAGVSWGIATEFRYSHRIVPDSLMPEWYPQRINEGYNQDDLYLSLIALSTLQNNGLDVDAKRACLERVDYQLEYGGRNPLVINQGIAPPDLGHPAFRDNSDGCSYTCGADFAGIIAPGLPQSAVKYADIFGTATAYGDGLYGGIFVGAMYSEAFFTNDLHAIINAGLRAIPSESLIAKAVSDVVLWHKQNPNDWKVAWQKIMDKYWWNTDNNWLSWPYGGSNKGINLDSKSMAAFAVMSLLYGESDPYKTLRIGVQSSEDADCNASIAGGVLFAALGMKSIDPTFYSAMKEDVRFRYMSSTFDDLMKTSEGLARQNIAKLGGRTEFRNGVEYIVVPSKSIDLRKERFLFSKTPDAPSGARYTKAELDEIELVDDPGFENQSSKWSFFTDNSANHMLPVECYLGFERFDENQSRTGVNNAILKSYFKNQYIRANTKLYVGVRQCVKVEPNRNYKLSYWVKNEGADLKGKCLLTVRSLDSQIIAEVKHGNKPQWSKVALEFNSGDNSYVEIAATMWGVNERHITGRYDDFSLKIAK